MAPPLDERELKKVAAQPRILLRSWATIFAPHHHLRPPSRHNQHHNHTPPRRADRPQLMGVPLVKSTDMPAETVSEIVDSIGTIVDKFASDNNWEVSRRTSGGGRCPVRCQRSSVEPARARAPESATEKKGEGDRGGSAAERKTELCTIAPPPSILSLSHAHTLSLSPSLALPVSPSPSPSLSLLALPLPLPPPHPPPHLCTNRTAGRVQDAQGGAGQEVWRQLAGGYVLFKTCIICGAYSFDACLYSRGACSRSPPTTNPRPWRLPALTLQVAMGEGFGFDCAHTQGNMVYIFYNTVGVLAYKI